MSSVPGAAAGVKTYMESSKDISKTALEREKMRRLADYQEKTLETKTLPYIRKNMMRVYWENEDTRKKYFKPGAQSMEETNILFEKEVIELARKPDALASFTAQRNRETTRKLWQEHTGNNLARTLTRELRENDKMSPTEKTRYIAQKVNEAFEKHLLETGGVSGTGTGTGAGAGGKRSLEAIYKAR